MMQIRPATARGVTALVTADRAGSEWPTSDIQPLAGVRFRVNNRESPTRRQAYGQAQLSEPAF